MQSPARRFVLIFNTINEETNTEISAVISKEVCENSQLCSETQAQTQILQNEKRNTKKQSNSVISTSHICQYQKTGDSSQCLQSECFKSNDTLQIFCNTLQILTGLRGRREEGSQANVQETQASGTLLNFQVCRTPLNFQV